MLEALVFLVRKFKEGHSMGQSAGREAYTSSGNENQNGQLVNDIKTMFERSKAPSVECHINRVPNHLRMVNAKAYTPMFISIGPFHHFNEKLQTAEKHKVKYVKSFMERNEVETNLESLVRTIRGMEESIYYCYEETISFSMHSDAFVKMILMDAIFIIELFLRYDNNSKKSDDPILGSQWMYPIMMLDLVLLENQLPFFVIEKLFNLAFPNHSNSLPLIEHTFKFFDCFNLQKMEPKDVKIDHFTDLYRTFYRLPPSSQPKGRTDTDRLKYSATQLKEAGVKFKVNPKKFLLDLNFDSKKGVLDMPCLRLYDQTEAFFRNVMALEQFLDEENQCITEYFIFLDFLINTTEDVYLLCNNGIVVNYLGDNEAAKHVVNNLNINISCPNINANYSGICKDLNAFYEKRCHKYMATLWHDYLNTPWRIASTIAAFVLLVLTFIQTVFSILH
nr:upf0481 protein [Quercus suber]